MKKKKVKQILLENIYIVLYRLYFLAGESVCGLWTGVALHSSSCPCVHYKRHSMTLSDPTVLTKSLTGGVIPEKPAFLGVRVQEWQDGQHPALSKLKPGRGSSVAKGMEVRKSMSTNSSSSFPIDPTPFSHAPCAHTLLDCSAWPHSKPKIFSAKCWSHVETAPRDPEDRIRKKWPVGLASEVSFHRLCESSG